MLRVTYSSERPPIQIAPHSRRRPPAPCALCNRQCSLNVFFTQPTAVYFTQIHLLCTYNLFLDKLKKTHDITHAQIPMEDSVYSMLRPACIIYSFLMSIKKYSAYRLIHMYNVYVTSIIRTSCVLCSVHMH